MKKIELFTFIYNDKDLLPFFLNHYEPLVDKMTFIDSGSDDGSLDLIKRHEVIQTGLTWWNWDVLHKIRQTIWKNSKYDLIFFPDLDEFFYRKNLNYFLESSDYDIYQLEGFQMVSDKFPKPNTDILKINKGIPLPLHSKYTIFNPRADIEFIDAHNIKTSSENISRFEIKLLHYKYLGVANMVRRTKLIQSRVPENSYCPNIGGNILKKFTSYVKTEEEYKIEISQMLKEAKVII